MTAASSQRRRAGIALGIAAMAIIVSASNFLVQFPINDWLTWGALTYPVAFLVTDLTNRSLGAAAARRVIYVGFACAVALSIGLATPRIALASGSAFLVAQLLDVFVFNRLRGQVWWMAPLVSSGLGSAVDTALFFSLAFAFTPVPWQTLAMGDFGLKLVLASVMLLPFRLMMSVLRPQPQST